MYTWESIGSLSALGISALCPQIILFWCSRAMYTWGQLVGGICLSWVCLHLSIGYIVFGVVGLCTLGVN